MSPSDSELPARERLLEAAILCFAEKGFDATGIRDIARRAKANSALVQYHFGGKTGIYAEALRCIFGCHHQVPELPLDPHSPDARGMAIRAMGELIEHTLIELMACEGGSKLEQASLLLVTRELQNPREDMAGLILEHMRPTNDRMLDCLRILRPDLEGPEAQDYADSVLGQIVHLLHHLPLMRLVRGDPGYPRDLQALARHITGFSLRGLGIPEAFPDA
jgi:AcrR family transcriptional regulator